MPPPLPTAIPVATPAAPPAAKPGPSRFEAASALLDRAVQGGAHDANVLYMLAMAYKRQGKNADARKALDRISRPDGNVFLQKALLALADDNLPGAEQELDRAWSADNTSYEVCYNLLLVRLTANKFDACAQLLPRAIELLDERPPAGVDAREEKRFLQVLLGLLRMAARPDGRADSSLAEITAADEQRLLKVIRSLGQLDTVLNLLRALSRARPGSGPLKEAYIEAVLVKGKELIDRCMYTEAELLLRPLERERGFSRPSQVALLNLLGCCSCVTQDFDGALGNFQAAVKLAPNDPRLHQNLALAFELNGNQAHAEPHWNRYFELVGDVAPAPRDVPRYREAVAFEALTRLSGRYGEAEKWAPAITYLQRALAYRGDDSDGLEKLFHLYQQAKRPGDARRTLDNLRRLKPTEPQYELYELDLIEVKGLNDIEKLLTDIDRIRRRHPDDARVEERAVNMVGSVIPLMGNLCDQLTDQMGKVVDQIRNLPDFQINWSAVREVMRDLLKEFQKLRRITTKCLQLVTSDEHKRIIRDLTDHIDKKIEACRSMGA